MAEAALEPTPENGSFYRISRLLIRGGTKIVQGLFNSIYDPSILPRILQNHRALLNHLKANKIITHKEMVKLFPSNTTYGESKNFDLTLLLKLLRNICNLTAPATGWDKLPSDNDLSLEADLTRIKYHRNNTLSMELTEHEFNDLWPQIQDALLRIVHHYSPGSVDEWRMAIEKSRTAPISSEDRTTLNEFPEMVIKVSGDMGHIDIASWDQDQRQSLIADIEAAIQKALSNNYIIVQDIKNDSINIQLRVKTVEALKDLWERYNNGDLRSALERVLIETQKLGENMEIEVTMSEEQYKNALIFFDELTQHKKKAMVIKVSGDMGHIDIASLDQDQRQSLMAAFQAAIQRALSNKDIIVQNIQSGSIIIQLLVKTVEALEDLWERYKNGDLRSALERVLIETQKLGEHIEISVTMSEEQYQDALIFFDELTQHKEKGFGLLPSISTSISVASWCKETDETNNYIEICRLLVAILCKEKDEKKNYKLFMLQVNGDTQALRSVFDGKHPTSSLKATLNANKTALQPLMEPRVRVLNNEQWDKLYPPCGSCPKSEDFDITLLFVLLRNICRLPAPAVTGCDVLPCVSDTTLQANLARIKYYRNNTITHKPNTDLNDSDFEQHWQGILYDHIDDLKPAPLGKKVYNPLLYDWYMSDKDITTVLEEMKSATASQTTAIKSDTVLFPGIREFISQLKHIYSGTHHITTLLKKMKSATVSLTTAIKSDTVLLPGIREDISQLKHIYSSTHHITTLLKEVKSATASQTTAIKSDTVLLPGIREDISQLKHIYSSTHVKDSLIDQLAYFDFRCLTESLCNSFHPNTRKWIMDEVKSHVYGDESQPCAMLIKAGPGMGKSSIAAKICYTYKDLGCLAGCHFFQFNNSTILFTP